MLFSPLRVVPVESQGGGVGKLIKIRRSEFQDRPRGCVLGTSQGTEALQASFPIPDRQQTVANHSA
jgi:hypothetical protein